MEAGLPPADFADCCREHSVLFPLSMLLSGSGVSVETMELTCSTLIDHLLARVGDLVEVLLGCLCLSSSEMVLTLAGSVSFDNRTKAPDWRVPTARTVGVVRRLPALSPCSHGHFFCLRLPSGT